MPTLPADPTTRPEDGVAVAVPAKINIGLAVGQVRPDGFHELRTLFHAIDLYDLVTARPHEQITLSLAGDEAAGLAADSSNLAWRAAQLLAERTGCRAGVQLQVTKQIPVAAGLAGGSADAAASLLACARLWQLQLTAAELDELAAELGSDVAFALHGRSAVGTGRGELLTDLPPHPPLPWVLAVGHRELATPAVYAELDRQRASTGQRAGSLDFAKLAVALQAGRPDQLAPLIGNDLQPAALALAPELDHTLAAGQQLGALAGLVSGSGPTCAFLAADAAAAEQLAVGLQASGSCRYARAVVGGLARISVLDPSSVAR